MSYDIELTDPKTGHVLPLPETVYSPEGQEVLTGYPTHAECNITYNYGPKIREVMHPDGVRWLYGQRAAQTIPALVLAREKLGQEPDALDADYWTPTDRNVHNALTILLTLAINCPEGVWQGD